MALDQDKIEELAEAPRKVETEEGTVSERSMDEIIKADKYLKSNSAPDGPLHGLRISKFKPAGPV